MYAPPGQMKLHRIVKVHTTPEGEEKFAKVEVDSLVLLDHRTIVDFQIKTEGQLNEEKMALEEEDKKKRNEKRFEQMERRVNGKGSSQPPTLRSTDRAVTKAASPKSDVDAKQIRQMSVFYGEPMQIFLNEGKIIFEDPNAMISPLPAASVQSPEPPTPSPFQKEAVSKPDEPASSVKKADAVSKPDEPASSAKVADAVSKPDEPVSSANDEVVSKPVEPVSSSKEEVVLESSAPIESTKGESTTPSPTPPPTPKETPKK